MIESTIDFASAADASALQLGILRSAYGDVYSAVTVFLQNFFMLKLRRGFEREIFSFLDHNEDRKCAVSGQSVSVRLDFGGSVIIKTHISMKQHIIHTKQHT